MIITPENSLVEISVELSQILAGCGNLLEYCKVYVPVLFLGYCWTLFVIDVYLKKYFLVLPCDRGIFNNFMSLIQYLVQLLLMSSLLLNATFTKR